VANTSRYVAVLILLVVMSWFPQSLPYFPVADDFPFAENMRTRGVIPTILGYYELNGIRRSVGMHTNLPICGLPEQYTGAACVALHSVATVLLFFALSAALSMPRLAFLCSTLFGVFPWGYGAISWACGSYVIPIVIVYLLQVILVVKCYRLVGRRRLFAIICLFCLSLYGCLIAEHLVFATALVGFLPFVLNERITSVRDLARAGLNGFVVVPMAAVTFYAVLVVLTSPSGMGSQDATAANMPLVWGNINPRTLLSVSYHQIRNLDMLQPLWTSSPKIWFWHGQTWISSGILLVGLLTSTVAVLNRKLFFGSPAAKTNQAIPAFIVWCIANILAVSAIHMLNGGYAASSRHQYVPLVFFVFLLAGLTTWMRAGQDIGGRVFLGICMTLTVVGVLSTWAVIGTNRYELRRYHALLDFLSQNPPADAVSLEFSPPLYHYWPKMERTISHPLNAEWVINCGLPSAGKVVIDPDNPRKIVVKELPGQEFSVTEDVQ
jgi:hypothetical protein